MQVKIGASPGQQHGGAAGNPQGASSATSASSASLTTLQVTEGDTWVPAHCVERGGGVGTQASSTSWQIGRCTAGPSGRGQTSLGPLPPGGGLFLNLELAVREVQPAGGGGGAVAAFGKAGAGPATSPAEVAVPPTPEADGTEPSPSPAVQSLALRPPGAARHRLAGRGTPGPASLAVRKSTVSRPEREARSHRPDSASGPRAARGGQRRERPLMSTVRVTTCLRSR